MMLCLPSSESEMTFDLTGVDASIANSLRRIMLSEVCGNGCDT